MKNTKLTLVLISTAFLAGCASLQRPEQNAAALAALPVAAYCDAKLPFFGYYRYDQDTPELYIGPDASIGVVNDGGWCAIRYQVTMPNGSLTTSEAIVTHPPAHGSTMVGTLDGKLRIAYRPAPGFTGEDTFSVYLTGPIPYKIPVAVRVGS